MLGLLKLFFYVLLIYYILKVVARLFFPILFKNLVSKAEQQMRNQQQKNQNAPETKVGETVIDKTPPTPKKDNNVGEYIDYEEVE